MSKTPTDKSALSPFHALTAVMKAKLCAAEAVDALTFPPDNFSEDQGEVCMFTQLRGAYESLVAATSYMRQVMMTVDPTGKLGDAFDVAVEETAAEQKSGDEVDDKTLAKLNKLLGTVEP